MALRVWYKICQSDVFHGIEWHSLSRELVKTHDSLFMLEEVEKLSDQKLSSEEAVTSAVKRDAPRVLHAVYQSLCATQTCYGAGQHASIAEEIQKESELHVLVQPVND